MVVCGRRDRDAYRVPATETGGLPGDVLGRAGEVPSASPDRLAGGPCGIFAGERRCGKAEMKLYGYDPANNPVARLLELGEALVDAE